MADYSYMTTPKSSATKASSNTNRLPSNPTAFSMDVAKTSSNSQGGDTPFHALGSPTPPAQNLSTNTYKPTTAQLPPAQNLSTYNANSNSGGSNWNLPTFKPTTTAAPLSGQTQTATPGGGSQNFWNASNPWKPGNLSNDDAGKINTLLPVAQFDQNNYQYANDFNAAQQRWNAEFGLTQNQTNYQQQLSTQQQLAAEQQAALAAQQWNQQFGHTQNMDMLGYGLSQQQTNNQFTQGMDQNQASRDVASTYAGAQNYQANQQLAGNKYQADQQLAGQLGSAGMYSDAQRYQALMGYQGQLGSANIYAGAQNYGADQQLAGQLGSAGLYSDAQRYQAQQQLAGQLGSANIYSGAQMYNTDAQERMNQLLMQNNLAVANTQAYGRSQAPVANWSRSWG